ncbi:heterokaryon incompatibility protein-domain-containing protein [Podospora conica]|nr:heterokaryon incompatibility protein-domain-containing protein [Schizothecium conicum]
MDPDNIAANLCSTCSKHTLQSLHLGTDDYPLSKDCYLCLLIWDSLRRNLKLSDGQVPPLIKLQNTKEEEYSAVFQDWVAGQDGGFYPKDDGEDTVRPLWSDLRRLFSKTLPVGLLRVHTPGWNQKHATTLKITPLHDSRSALAPHVCGRQVLPAASDDNIEMMRGWISSCVAGHSSCRTSVSGKTLKDNKEPQPLPTRLIEVTPKVRLRGTAGQCGQYLALSYCWGTGTDGSQASTTNTVTTQANIDSFYNDIPLEMLAPTIRDAVLLTQRLGFRYLWVDAICIIQGDTADWERESRQMANVFENALCTIVALGANHAGEGLFLSGNDTAPTESMEAVTIPCSAKTGEILGHVSITAWPSLEAGLLLFPGRDFFRARWSRRGWVLQERMLSRRMLYFGRGQIYWTCMERMIHEDGMDHYHSNDLVCNGHHLRRFFNAMTLSAFLRFIPILRQLSHSLWGDRRTIMQDIWELLVLDYTRCSITVESDKLMAVEGLASALSHRSGMTYFHGLWIEMACFGLAWKAKSVSEFPIDTSVGQDCVPSWSWGSSRGLVSFLSRDRWHHRGKASAKATVKTLASGRRVLELHAAVIHIASSKPVPGSSHFSSYDLDHKYHLLGWYDRGTLKECRSCASGDIKHSFAVDTSGQIFGLLEFDRSEYLDREIQAILLFEAKDWSPGYTVLLVEQVPGNPGFFRRLGVGTLYSYPSFWTEEKGSLVGVGKKRVFQLI